MEKPGVQFAFIDPLEVGADGMRHLPLFLHGHRLELRLASAHKPQRSCGCRFFEFRLSLGDDWQHSSRSNEHLHSHPMIRPS